MSVVAGAVGFLALACTVTDIDPHLGVAVSKPHAVSFIGRDGQVSVIGFEELAGTEKMTVSRQPNGSLIARGARFRDSRGGAWAIIKKRAASDEYDMEWQMIGEYARDGRHTVATWARGTCDELGASDKGAAE